jgi:hypothetical protein
MNEQGTRKATDWDRITAISAVYGDSAEDTARSR